MTNRPNAVASPVLPTGAINAVRLADRLGPPTADVRDHMPNAIMVWGGSSAPVLLSALFPPGSTQQSAAAALAAAQAVYPAATSLTQSVDLCAAQRAHDVLYAAGGGTLYLPPTPVAAWFSGSLLHKPNRVKIRGEHLSNTIIDISACGANVPAFFVTGTYNSPNGYQSGGVEIIISSLTIRGKLNGSNPNGLQAGILSDTFATLAAAQVAFPTATSLSQHFAGLPSTGFVPDSVGIHTENLAGFVFDRIGFQWLDRTTTWGDNCWGANLFYCQATNCNKGAVWDKMPTRLNSGENCRWMFGSYSNCNYNIWIDASTADGGPLGSSFVVSGPSCDYPNSLFVYYRGSATSYSQSRLYIDGGPHWETTGATTGQDTPMYAEYGPIFFKGVAIQWSDSLAPRGLITSLTDKYNGGDTHAYFDACSQLGLNVPYGVGMSNQTWAKLGMTAPPSGFDPTHVFTVRCRDCLQQDETQVVVSTFNSGTVLQRGPEDVTDTVVNGGSIKPIWQGGTVTVLGSGNIDLSDQTNIVSRGGAPIRFVIGEGAWTWSSTSGNGIVVPVGKIAQCSRPSGGVVMAVNIYGTWQLSGDLDDAPLVNATNDAAAASAGVVVGQRYRNGSVLMTRVA